MAGKNQRSATLPSSLRHGIQQTEESEGFFTKLKKKFKLKKGRYHVDVNTGECQNVAAVSFKKRESREVPDDESPWQLRDPKSEERELKLNSTKLSKLSHGKQTDKNSLGGKERKLSNPETYTRSLNSSEISSFQRNSFGAKPKSTNEYSPLTYDTKENVAERSLKLRESALKNEFIVHDDSAIELDPDVEAANKVSETDNEVIDIDYDPGYEKLPDRRGNTSKTSEVPKPEFDPKYESVKEVQEKVKCENEFDPNYESVDEVKSRMLKLKDKDDDFSIDPGYQSVRDVKRETSDRPTGELIRPPKTYSLNQSIESLDEPGYESLNDVKKRIKDQSIDNADKRTSEQIYDHVSKSTDISQNFTEGEYLDDSAIGSVPKYGCSPQNDLSRNRSLSGDGSVTPDSNGGLRAFAETAVSLTGIATAVTGSGPNKDSGFKSKERSSAPDHEDNLYSSVKKEGKTRSENPYSMVKKDRKQSDGDRQAETATISDKTCNATVAPEPGLDDSDSDTGVMLDPGYAECADAIKGIIPYSIYSEGSGSKMSSCTSLDLSAEDFALEPGYAECADAIKSGAIKKISVSHERLVDHSFGTKNEDIKAKGEINSEIYANPQILFRKKSKLIEDGNLEDLRETNEKTAAIDDKSSSPEKEICLAMENKGKKKEKNSKNLKETKALPLEAPPLPARNYSLYLENEEAEEVVQEVLQDCAYDEIIDESSLDEAFETKESGIVVDALTKPDTKTFSDTKNKTEEKKAEVSVGLLEMNSNLQRGSGYEAAKPDNGSTSNEDISETYDKSAHSVEKEAVDETSESVRNNQDNSSYLSSNENKTKEDGNEQVHLGSSAKCSEMCVTNTEGSDLTEKDNCKRKTFHDCSDETNKLMQEVTEAKNSIPSSGNCLQVNVKDERGNVKVLKVVEKEESPTLQKKRENSRKKSAHCLEGKSVENYNKGDEISTECNELAAEFCAKNDLSHTKDLSDSESVSPNSTKSVETKNTCIANHVNQRSTSSESVIQNSCEKTDSAVNEPQLTLTVQSCKDETKNINIVSGHVNTYHANTFNYINGLSEVDSNNFLTVAVKMKNISVDSDSDFFNTEDLPKLEINESDLESPFDSSDNSNNLDIENESAGIDKLTQRLNAEDIPEVCSQQTIPEFDLISCKSEKTCSECVVNQNVEENDVERNKFCSNNDNGKEVSLDNDVQSESLRKIDDQIIQLDKMSAQPLEEKLCSDKTDIIHDNYALKATNEVPEVSESLCEDKTNDKNATLESKLCVIEPEKEGETDIAKLMRGNSDDANAETDSADNELSDDSAIGNINDLQLSNDYLHSDIDGALSCCNNTENVSHIVQIKEVESKSSGNVSSQDLHLIYTKEHPSLYEDSEPTHMSLQEVMGLSHDQMTITQAEDSVTSPNTFLTHIPNDDQESSITPPPRPPPVALSRQSRNMFSPSSPSSQNTATLTPTDEVPIPLRLSYGLSDEGSPPAIPPRLKSVRGTKRPVSYSQDFMESMRQLKDCGWYWGPLSWEEAEHKLAKKPEGTFLVRDSSDEHYILSLSFKNQGRVHHTRIEHHKGHFSFWSQPDSHGKSTIKEFIEQCVENSRNGRFLYFIRPSGPGSPPMPIQLLNPVSRFVQMRSLQHMCRFRILQLVRRDHIDLLPVPTRIKQYLKEAQYYVEYLDD